MLTSFSEKTVALSQKLIVSVPKVSVDDHERENFFQAIEQGCFAGVILFKKDFEKKQNIKQMIAQMKRVASCRPFFIGVDQERGAVARIVPESTHALCPCSLKLTKLPSGVQQKHFATK